MMRAPSSNVQLTVQFGIATPSSVFLSSFSAFSALECQLNWASAVRPGYNKNSTKISEITDVSSSPASIVIVQVAPGSEEKQRWF
jgi:hypothetical protein